jgi:hypothetical protein
MKSLVTTRQLCQCSPMCTSLVDRLASIGLLLAAVFPFAVFRRIGTIVIDAAKSHSGRTFAHIRKEIFERIPPSITNGDSTSAITWKAGLARAIATVFHRSPHTPLWRLFHAVRGVARSCLTPQPFVSASVRTQASIGGYSANFTSVHFNNVLQYIKL